MAIEPLSPISLPVPASTGLLHAWARDMVRVLTTGLKLLVRRLNDAVADLETAIADIAAQATILSAATATTSGTAHTLTGIPARAQEVVLTLAGVSTDGTDPLVITLGDSGGLETSGYTGVRASTDDTTTNSGSLTAFIALTIAAVATLTYSGRVVLTLVDSTTNTWAFSGMLAADDTDDIIYYFAGAKSLSAVLTQISLTTSGGTDVFDAGKLGMLVK